MAQRITRDTKLISFNFKITHRIIACNQQLEKWEIKTSDKYDQCGETDTIKHHLVKCPNTLIFWQYVFNW